MVAVILLGVLIIARLFSLQIVKSSAYAERAERQYITPTSSIFNRGTIYFTKRDGVTVAAATVASGFKVTINPSALTDARAAYAALSEIIPVDEDDFFEKAAKKKDPYEEIANRVSKGQAERITEKGIPGVSVFKEKWRFYPGEQLAAKTIGFVSYKDTELLGRYGLERSYNDVLTRTNDSFYVNFFAEIFANIQSTIFKNRAATGDVVTSIEPSAQGMLETTVENVRKQYDSDAVGGIIMDPHTGAIIAMAHVPSFNLNEFSKVDDVSLYGNPLVENVYEMGSTIKPLVMAAAIDAGTVTPETTYTDRGSVQVDDRTFNNFDKKARGVATMQDVLNQSLNTGMVFVQQKMGKNTFRDYMAKYQLGEKTGIDLPGEVSGLVGNLKSPGNVAYATASFGQGIATTPIATLKAFSALANDGVMVTPHLGLRLELEDGTTKELTYKEGDRVLKPETVETMRQMLVTVVDKGYNRGMEHYSIAAKTGTAQIARPGGGGYYDDRNLHSLIGYFPASNPRFVVYLFNYYPKGVSFAAQSLADPFFEMVKSLISYYEISPDR